MRWYLFLTILGLFSQSLEAQLTGVYQSAIVKAERDRLEQKATQMVEIIIDQLIDSRDAFRLSDVILDFPDVDPDHYLNFSANSQTKRITIPIHSLLLLEDLCTAYTWLEKHNYDLETLNEYASVLLHRDPKSFDVGDLEPLTALGIPKNVLEDPDVDKKSLMLRNATFAFALTHELAHVLYQHMGNSNVSSTKSQSAEYEADLFAIKTLMKDSDIPVGPVYYFFLTAFISSPSPLDYPDKISWQNAVTRSSHPMNASRIRQLGHAIIEASGQSSSMEFEKKSLATKLEVMANNFEDINWHRYLRHVGQKESLNYIKARKTKN